ncbi:MAG: DUF4369 domain-containing protein [Flavobacteriaceae bacterium]|nr:DUF4369 domain-containing protein [Flavobacteriaceae bacterium]
MKKVFVIGLLLLIAACSKEKEQGNMIVQGQIKGLKKGTLYLQKMKDSLVTSVDSITLLGKSTFILSDNIESPEMYYLAFDDKTTVKRVRFFGEKGTITINDNVNNFGVGTKIEGSKNQKVMEDYERMTKKFQNKQLDLIEANFNAQLKNNIKESDSLRKISDKLLRKRYLFSANFALTHPDAEASAFITITDLVDANIKILDTIQNTLSDNVKNSLYGKKLQKFIADIKKNEQ